MFDNIMTRRSEETAIDIVNAVLGVCLALAPWALGFTGEVAAAWNAWIVGAAIALVAVGALVAFTQWEEWANLILGVWAVLAPWLVAFSGGASATSPHLIIGLVRAVLAATELWMVSKRPFSTT